MEKSPELVLTAAPHCSAVADTCCALQEPSDEEAPISFAKIGIKRPVLAPPRRSASQERGDVRVDAVAAGAVAAGAVAADAVAADAVAAQAPAPAPPRWPLSRT